MNTKNRMMSDRELSDFCNQLAMILQAGISLAEGLDMMLEDTASEGESAILTALKEELERTGLFADALEAAAVFPAYMNQMVRIGEQTGHLDDVMLSLAEHYDRNDAVRQSIRSALFYPAMMFVLMLVIVTVLLTNVMPIFNQVFLQLGAELSGVSRVLLDLGQGIKRYMVVLAVLAAVLVLGGLCAARIPRARAAVMGRLARLGFVRKLWDSLFLFRFSSGMMMTLSSGMAPEESLDMIETLSGDDPVSRKRLEDCRARLEEGEDFCQALCSTGIFSGVYSRMAAIGQKTGTMEQVMQNIARNSQEEFSQAIARMLGMIEPTLVAVLSILVGVILMSVMFPLLGILSGM